MSKKKKQKHNPDDIIIKDTSMFFLDEVLIKVRERKQLREERTKN